MSNEISRPPGIDFIETLFHKYGDDVARKFWSTLPQKLKMEFLRSNVVKELASKGLLVAAFGVGRGVPNTPGWRLLDSGLKIFFAKISDIIDDVGVGEGAEKIVKNLNQSSELREVFGAVKSAIRFGILEVDADSSKNILGWVGSVEEKKGIELAHQALSMLNALSTVQLATFAELELAQKTTFFNAFRYKREEQKKQKGPGFIERQRKEMDASTDKIIWATGVKNYVEGEAFKERIEKAKITYSNRPKRQSGFSFWELLPISRQIVRRRRRRRELKAREVTAIADQEYIQQFVEPQTQPDEANVQSATQIPSARFRRFMGLQSQPSEANARPAPRASSARFRPVQHPPSVHKAETRVANFTLQDLNDSVEMFPIEVGDGDIVESIDLDKTTTAPNLYLQVVELLKEEE